MSKSRGWRRPTSRVWTAYRMQELQNLSIALHPPPPPTPTEPFREVINQYMDTLCTKQKQTNLTNSLLQDIAVFNEYDSTNLVEWLTDIETAVDLTNES